MYALLPYLPAYHLSVIYKYIHCLKMIYWALWCSVPINKISRLKDSNSDIVCPDGTVCLHGPGDSNFCITAVSTSLCNHFDLSFIAKINYPKFGGLNNTWDCVMVLKIVSPKPSPGANSRHLRLVCFRGCGRNPLLSLSPVPPVLSASGCLFLPSSCSLFYSLLFWSSQLSC